VNIPNQIMKETIQKLLFREKKIILSLGANSGKIEDNFSLALCELRKNGLNKLKVSRFYKNKAWGCAPGTADFINAAVSGFWGRSLQELHDTCKRLETDAGRSPDHPKWSSRPLDIDIVFFGKLCFSDENLTIPHKDALNRIFVLAPVAEIEADFKIPRCRISVAEYLNSHFDEKLIAQFRQTGKKLEFNTQLKYIRNQNKN
jgi:2-amino-4-hydroxy-6-hydroxymethyldihydropteridine diphosphokinase